MPPPARAALLLAGLLALGAAANEASAGWWWEGPAAVQLRGGSRPSAAGALTLDGAGEGGGDAADDEGEEPLLAQLPAEGDEEDDEVSLLEEPSTAWDMQEPAGLVPSVAALYAAGGEGEEKELSPLEKLPAKGAVQDTFVKKCTVAMSVGRKRDLPVEPLERFCKSTKHFLDCKMQLSMKLQEAYEERRSLSDFCMDAYRWFLKKYGMLCPYQCEKLTCKSTCVWLEEKKKIEAEAKELKAANYEASVLQREFVKLRKTAGEKEDVRRADNRTLTSARMEVERAAQYLEESRQYLGRLEERVNKLEKRIQSLEESLTDSGMKIMEYQMEISEMQFKLDKLELKHSHLLKEGQVLGDKIVDAAADLEGFPAQIAVTKKEMEERLLATEELLNTAKLLEEIIGDQEVVVERAAMAYKRATESLRQAKREKNADPVIINFEDLVSQQEGNFRKQVAVLKTANRYHEKLHHESKLNMKEVDVRLEEIEDSEVKTRELTERVSELVEQLQKKEKEARDLTQGPLATLIAQLTQKRTLLGKVTKEHLHANRTLVGVLVIHGEETEDLEQELARVRNHSATLKKAEAEFQEVERKFNASNEVFMEAEEAMLKAKAEWMDASDGLGDRMSANEKAARILKRRTPELVTMHGLGLYQLLGDDEW